MTPLTCGCRRRELKRCHRADSRPGGTPTEISRGQVRASGRSPRKPCEVSPCPGGASKKNTRNLIWYRGGDQRDVFVPRGAKSFSDAPQGHARSNPPPGAAPAGADLPPANLLRRPSGTKNPPSRSDLSGIHRRGDCQGWQPEVLPHLQHHAINLREKSPGRRPVILRRRRRGADLNHQLLEAGDPLHRDLQLMVARNHAGTISTIPRKLPSVSFSNSRTWPPPRHLTRATDIEIPSFHNPLLSFPVWP